MAESSSVRTGKPLDEPAGAAKRLACFFCGKSLHPYLELRPPFSLHRCPSCQLVATQPQPSAEALDILYRGEYQQQFSLPFALQLRRRQEVLALIESYMPKGLLFDLGCGPGHFLDFAHKRGWEVVGLEPNRAMAEYARRTFQLEVHAGSVEQIPAPLRDRKFDVVYLSHVLEHVLTPQCVLESLKDILAAEGVLVVRVPNLDCLFFRLLGRHYLELYPATHMFHYTRTTLARLLEKQGYALVDIRTRQCDFAHEVFILVKGLVDVAGLYDKVRPSEAVWSEAPASEPAYRRRAWARTLLVPLYVATLPVWVVSARVGLGYEIFAVARPK